VDWLKRYPIAVNIALGFAVALLAGIWMNFFAASSTDLPMPNSQHLLLFVAILIIGFQAWYGESLSRIEKSVIVELLDFGIRFSVANANKEISPTDVRVIVHLVESVRPGRKLPKQRCLVPRYWKSPVTPRDFGRIPIDAKSFADWYLNVQAFLKQDVVYGEPVLEDRPPADGHFVSTPSLFDAKSVLSAPIWCRNPSNPHIIGTLTFDAIFNAEDMNWEKDGNICEPAKDMINSLADLIGKVLSDDYRNS
jgi:hypothetical protein